MAEMEERELLLRSLKGYLTDLADSGVDELAFAAAAAVDAAVSAGPVAEAAPAGTSSTAPAPSARPAVSAPAAPGQKELLRQDGNPRARLLLLMNGSGYQGAAGQLLAKIIAAMKLQRDEVCLLSFDSGCDVAALRAAVATSVETVAPEVVVTLGEEATFLLLGKGGDLDEVRGRFQEVRGREIMPTLHPELLLADETLKRHVWEDMKLVMRRLGTAAPAGGGTTP